MLWWSPFPNPRSCLETSVVCQGCQGPVSKAQGKASDYELPARQPVVTRVGSLLAHGGDPACTVPNTWWATASSWPSSSDRVRIRISGLSFTSKVGLTVQQLHHPHSILLLPLTPLRDWLYPTYWLGYQEGKSFISFFYFSITSLL
jgi:hypothetical protein